MVESQNHFVERIGGRRNRRRAGAVALVIEGIRPIERIPGVIGSVAIDLYRYAEPIPEPTPSLTQDVEALLKTELDRWQFKV